MKIAMIGQKGLPAQSGGVEKHVEEIGKRLVNAGYELTVFNRKHYSSIKDKSNHNGIVIKNLPSINTKHLDAITHTFCSTVYSMLSFIPRLLSHKKIVVTVHGLDWQRAKWGYLAKQILKLGEITSAFFPHKLIIVSNTLRNYYQEKYKIDPVFIPNGVTLPTKISASEIKEKFGLQPQKYILFLARLVPEKGAHYLLEAFSKIKTDLKLVIAGGSSNSDDYVLTLEKYKSFPNIIFTGQVSGNLLQELYSNAYIYVLPSDLEGLPISLLEAMSYQLPCLISDIPENLEVGHDCSLTFRKADSEDLAQKLIYAINNPEDLSRLAVKGFNKVKENYSWERVVQQTIAVYQSLL
ncbi:glycosyltransferase family 4 protein [Carboxydocella sp. JDF658]|uniref:glycosyltransferase family 4 protein n=1 Tax=Carboxydocella sp. JDF658 TaxID=1926600 RepID=UPI0009AC8AB6|nr:glycosyltransferase family 4 protein [Carboxydocella sp. JDF658]GAW32742.1 glycosyl transferase [Carboxydocella sp. JDF658]